jgi:hypothetical protein
MHRPGTHLTCPPWSTQATRTGLSDGYRPIASFTLVRAPGLEALAFRDCVTPLGFGDELGSLRFTALGSTTEEWLVSNLYTIGRRYQPAVGLYTSFLSTAIAAGVVERLMEGRDLVAMLEAEERGVRKSGVTSRSIR